MQHTIETNFYTMRSFKANRLLSNVKITNFNLLPAEISMLDRITFLNQFEKANTIDKLYRKVILTEYKKGKQTSEIKIKL